MPNIQPSRRMYTGAHGPSFPCSTAMTPTCVDTGKAPPVPHPTHNPTTRCPQPMRLARRKSRQLRRMEREGETHGKTLSSPVTKHDSSRPLKHASGFPKEVATSAAAVKAVNPLAEEFDHSVSRSYSPESLPILFSFPPQTVCIPYSHPSLVSETSIFRIHLNGGSTSLPLRRGPGNQSLISSLCSSTLNGVHLIKKCHPDHPNCSAPQTPGCQS